MAARRMPRFPPYTLPYAALLLTVALALGACQTDGNPAQTTPTAAPTATTGVTSGTPTSTSPPTTGAQTTPYPAEVPAEARVNSLDGAKAFIRYFYAQLSKAYMTPAVGLLAPLSEEGCGACRGYEDDARSYLENNQHYTNNPIEILEIGRSPGSTSPGVLRLGVLIRQTPAKLVSADGTVVEGVPDEKAVFVTELTYREGWKMVAIRVRR